MVIFLLHFIRLPYVSHPPHHMWTVLNARHKHLWNRTIIVKRSFYWRNFFSLARVERTENGLAVIQSWPIIPSFVLPSFPEWCDDEDKSQKNIYAIWCLFHTKKNLIWKFKMKRKKIWKYTINSVYFFSLGAKHLERRFCQKTFENLCTGMPPVLLLSVQEKS